MRDISAVFLAASLTTAVHGCTTIIAGRLATADGSVMCTHSNDGEGETDPRLVYVPAADYPPGTMRPVFWSPELYPRYVGSARNISAYAPVDGQTPLEPIGYIEQVAHTYSYMEETYGTINEHQVGIGESTCSGVFSAKALGHGGQALFSVDTLTQLAMERTNSSRAAVELMGRMAEAHGFYGQDDSFEGGAESLLVTDPHEGWIFHILSDPTKKSAIWAAQRVPDDHIGVVANAFVIRDLDPNDKANFLFSQSVYDVAQAQGWWRPDHGLLDFAGIYSDGEYAHKFYSGRRVWGVYHLLAPSLRLSPDYEEYLKSRPYPVTAKPDKKVSVADLADVHRSYYEGTQFDQTVSIAAGPFGTPDHVASGPASGSNVTGNWERTIGLWRTSDTTIVQSRSWLPNAVGGVLWYGPHAAPYTLFVPFACGMTSLPASTLGFQAKLDKGSLYWGVRYLANLVQLKRNLAVKDVVKLQQDMMTKSLNMQASVDAMAGSVGAPLDPTPIYLDHARELLAALWGATDALMFKYADGWVNEYTPQGNFKSSTVPAPDWWLRAVNYTGGPPPVPPRPHRE